MLVAFGLRARVWPVRDSVDKTQVECNFANLSEGPVQRENSWPVKRNCNNRDGFLRRAVGTFSLPP